GLMQECPELAQQPMSEATSTKDSTVNSEFSNPANASPSQQPAAERWRGSFWALIVVQFQGAFSLNVLRYLLTFMVMGATISEARSDTLVSLISFLFFLPLVLFSMAGGFLADRFSKRQVTLATKVIEIAAMVLAIFALTSTQQQYLGEVVDLWRRPALLLAHFPVPLLVLFLAATQAALFGPSKYGLLPELLPEKWLSWGNGVIELGTFLAIISGAMAAGWLSQIFHGREWQVAVLLAAFSGLGLLFSAALGRGAAAPPPARFPANFLGSLLGQIPLTRPSRPPSPSTVP